MSGKDFQGPRNQIVIASHAHARAADVERDRPHPFVGVRLDLLLRAEHGDRAVAQIIVQLRDRAIDDAIGLGPMGRPVAARPRTRGR